MTVGFAMFLWLQRASLALVLLYLCECIVVDGSIISTAFSRYSENFFILDPQSDEVVKGFEADEEIIESTVDFNRPKFLEISYFHGACTKQSTSWDIFNTVSDEEKYHKAKNKVHPEASAKSVLQGSRIITSADKTTFHYENRKLHGSLRKDSLAKVIADEELKYFMAEGYKILPGEAARITFDLHDSLKSERHFRLGLGSIEGRSPGEDKHREWIINSDGTLSVVGMASAKFDKKKDIFWGALSYDGINFDHSQSITESVQALTESGIVSNVFESIDMTVNLRFEETNFVTFQKFLTLEIPSKKSTLQIVKIPASQRIYMTLDGFAKFIGSTETLNYPAAFRKQQVVFEKTTVPFELPKFGPPLPHEKPIEAELFLVEPKDACRFTELSQRYGPAAKRVEMRNALKGRVAFVYRGSCDFADKVYNVQRLGAIAAIVANNYAGDGKVDQTELIVMVGGDNPNARHVKIPSVFVSLATATHVEHMFKQQRQRPKSQRKPINAFLAGGYQGVKYNGMSFMDTGLQPIIWLPPEMKVSISKTLMNPLFSAEETKKPAPIYLTLHQFYAKFLADATAARSSDPRTASRANKISQLFSVKAKNRIFEFSHPSSALAETDEYYLSENCKPIRYLPLSYTELLRHLENRPRDGTKRIVRTMLSCEEENTLHSSDLHHFLSMLPEFTQLAGTSGNLNSKILFTMENLWKKLDKQDFLVLSGLDGREDDYYSTFFSRNNRRFLPHLPWNGRRESVFKTLGPDSRNIFDSPAGSYKKVLTSVLNRLEENHSFNLKNRNRWRYQHASTNNRDDIFCKQNYAFGFSPEEALITSQAFEVEDDFEEESVSEVDEAANDTNETDSRLNSTSIANDSVNESEIIKKNVEHKKFTCGWEFDFVPETEKIIKKQFFHWQFEVASLKDLEEEIEVTIGIDFRGGSLQPSWLPKIVMNENGTFYSMKNGKRRVKLDDSSSEIPESPGKISLLFDSLDGFAYILWTPATEDDSPVSSLKDSRLLRIQPDVSKLLNTRSVNQANGRSSVPSPFLDAIGFSPDGLPFPYRLKNSKRYENWQTIQDNLLVPSVTIKTRTAKSTLSFSSMDIITIDDTFPNSFNKIYTNVVSHQCSLCEDEWNLVGNEEIWAFVSICSCSAPSVFG